MRTGPRVCASRDSAERPVASAAGGVRRDHYCPAADQRGLLRLQFSIEDDAFRDHLVGDLVTPREGSFRIGPLVRC